MKNLFFPQRKYMKRAFALAFIPFLFAMSLFVSCEHEPTWNEPVRDYLDKYSNTAAIEKHEISCEYLKDSSDEICIPSDGDKTVTFFLRNPRQYTLSPITFSVPDSGITVSQDTSDRTVIRVTYPQNYLENNDGGGSIGGTIGLTESETLREFESYTFSLKCNTPPPSVIGQSVQSDSSTYYVCFYLPTTELGSTRHQNDTHTLFVNGSPIVTGSATELAAASSSRPGSLNPVGNNASFNATAPDGYTAFYYNTNRTVVDGDDINWSIRLEDDDGLSSRTVTASTIVPPVALTVSGDDVLTLSSGEDTTTLTASVNEGNISSCTWASTPAGIVTVSSSTPTSNTATVTASSGGEATVTVNATLADGRVVTQQKTVRVLSLEYNSSSPQDFLKGQNGIYPEVAALGFPTSSPAYTWEIGDSSVATINSAAGAINALAKGSTTVTVSASYGGKTVSKTTDIYVHEVTVSGVTELFVGGTGKTLMATVNPPTGSSAPGGITYSWTPGTGSAATISSSGSTCTVSPGSDVGTQTVTCKATLNGVQVTVATKTINVYKIVLDKTAPASRNTTAANGGTNPYALTDLSDPFTFEVKTASQFPTGTKFHWTVNDISLTGPTQQGSSVSIAPNAMGITSTSISKVKASPTSFDVLCQVELPSGTRSQTVQMSLNVYKLTIPPMKITVETTPALPTTSGAYHINSTDMTKTFKFKAEPATAGSFVPSGVSYTWKVGTRNVGSGSEITPSISTLRNGSTAIPTVNQTLDLSCEVSLTGCDTVTTPSKRIEFAAPKTFDTSITSGITNVSGLTLEGTVNSYGQVFYAVKPSEWENDFTVGLSDSVTLPEGCTISWSFTNGSVNKTGTGRTFSLTPKEYYGGEEHSDSGNNGAWSISYTISAPGYTKVTGNTGSKIVIKKVTETWTPSP